MEQLTQFGSAIAPFAITGAIVSIIVQYTKSFFEKRGNKLLWAIGVSVVGGIVLQFANLIPTNWLTTIAAVFASANTVYLLVIQWTEVPKQTPPSA